ncbi:MAG: protein kinase domain-containing protein, partial [Fimbriiglobus sp.]
SFLGTDALPPRTPRSNAPESGAVVAGPRAPRGYRLLRNLGEGSYGTVFLAEDETIPGLKVAIKFFARGPGAQWQSLQDEVRRLVTLDGVSGIVQIKDVAADAVPPYFVMSFAEGGSLAGRLDRGPLPVAEAVGLMAKVADALAVVHGKGIIHCDLKPGNVLLDASGQPLLADFGLAQFAEDMAPAVGTFFYMAPEQANMQGGLPDTRWDVHALGAMLYALITGGPPRLDTTLAAHLGAASNIVEQFRLYRELSGKLPPPTGHYLVPGMDRSLARIIDRCLAVDPAVRYRDAAAFRTALRERDAARQRQPLLWLAGAATAAFLGLTVVGGYKVTSTALSRTSTILADQDRSDNVVSARLVADLLRAELHLRIDRLQDFADIPRVRELMATAAGRIPKDGTAAAVTDPERTAAQTELDALYARGGAELFPDGLGLAAAAHGRGFLLAGVAAEPPPAWFRHLPGDFLNTDVADTEWFTGRPAAGPGPHPPTANPYISGPFRNKLLGGSDPVVAFSVPVLPPGATDAAAPVGVIVGMIRLAQTGSLIDVRLGVNDPAHPADSVVLANDRGQCVIHPRLGAAGFAPPPDAAAPPALAQMLAAAHARIDAQGSADLTDAAPDLRVWPPGDRTPHVAAAEFVPTEDVPGAKPWTVFTVRDPDVAARPVADLRRSLVGVEAVRVLVFAAGCGALWAGLLWALRRPT